MSPRVFSIAWKELQQVRRDRLTVAMMVILPIVQLLLFGYAINTDVRHIHTVVYDQDKSAESRDLVQSMESTGFYDIVGEVDDYADLEHAVRAGVARAAIVIPAEYASDLRTGHPTSVQLVVDGSDPQTVASATNTAASLVAARSSELLVSRLSAKGAAPVTLEPVTWYNPDLRTAVYIVPGLVGVLLTMTMVMLTAMAIARERERGTMEQLLVSPVTPFELVAGKIAPYVIIGYVQMTLILGAGRIVFHVPFAGSLALLYGVAIVFIAANLALGLVFSTLVKTQQQAMQATFFFLLPNILLSGFMFPFEGMPVPAQIISTALPLTHFLRIVRGITLKGSGSADVGGEVVQMAFILGVLVVLAATRLNKRLA